MAMISPLETICRVIVHEVKSLKSRYYKALIGNHLLSIRLEGKITYSVLSSLLDNTKHLISVNKVLYLKGSQQTRPLHLYKLLQNWVCIWRSNVINSRLFRKSRSWNSEQSQAKQVSNSRSKLHQTWSAPFCAPLYTILEWLLVIYKVNLLMKYKSPRRM